MAVTHLLSLATGPDQAIPYFVARKLDDAFVPRRRALELDQVVVGAVGRQQRAGVLEVLALGVALQLARVAEMAVV